MQFGIQKIARAIGIDDWAWRKGHRYGTLICDLERRSIVDLLSDREPATVAAWLAERPSIEIIARDRGGGYGAGAAKGRPEAVKRRSIGTPYRRAKGTPVALARGGPDRGHSSPMAKAGQARFLNRQLSLPVSTMSQW